jgi:putative ABC transport system substrate-binding protein
VRPVLRRPSELSDDMRNFRFSVEGKRMNRRSWARWLESFSDNLKSKTCPFDILRAGSELGRRIENRKWAGLFAIVLALTLVGAGEAQQLKKVPLIGVISTGSPSSTGTTLLDAFRKGLHELGYVEGKTIGIEYRYAEGKPERLPALAAELVSLKVAVIVTGGTVAVQAAKQASNMIPIVVGAATDLVGTGLVASLAKPGGNVTGLTSISPDLSGKWLELVREVVLKASRVAVLWQPNPWDREEVTQTEVAARQFGVKVQSVEVSDSNAFSNAYAAMVSQRANALIIIQRTFTGFHQKQLIGLAIKNRLPSMCDSPGWTENGCLMSYGSNRREMWRRAATYVDKILKGAQPAELPVQQPTKFEFVINLKTAKALNLTIPQSVLYRADKVIK